MSAERFAMLEDIAHRISLRDLAELARIRRALAALDTEAAALRRAEASEVAAADINDPAAARLLARFREVNAARIQALLERRAAMAADEAAARAAAIRALGRAHAAARLRRRAEAEASAARARREERALAFRS
ncbi:hypothetical protein G5B40_17020 [Pikeienuella piscinae]|uniref:Uncharacterized protein n=1 Tax=Pikeienuella piscinae TaxID=2748098 RepID=A0A7L5BX80_9RHOB|nr:hypothetical protein [Pikeienuella piscinae]QIE56990.1 hypothetical protein G5B40_17020 [Pikeienuella piscinae]